MKQSLQRGFDTDEHPGWPEYWGEVVIFMSWKNSSSLPPSLTVSAWRQKMTVFCSSCTWWSSPWHLFFFFRCMICILYMSIWSWITLPAVVGQTFGEERWLLELIQPHTKMSCFSQQKRRWKSNVKKKSVYLSLHPCAWAIIFYKNNVWRWVQPYARCTEFPNK